MGLSKWINATIWKWCCYSSSRILRRGNFLGD